MVRIPWREEMIGLQQEGGDYNQLSAGGIEFIKPYPGGEQEQLESEERILNHAEEIKAKALEALGIIG